LIHLLPIPVCIAIALMVEFFRQALRNYRIVQAQLAAYRRGDYEGQLKIVEGFRVRGSQPRHYLFFHGSASYQIGRLQEAEQALGRSLAMEKNRLLRTLCRDELGRVLMEQGRRDDAAACFRECMEESPHRGGCHRSMAELLLRTGQNPAAALDAARRAVDDDRTTKVPAGQLGREDHDLSLAESLAVLAWAMARTDASSPEVDIVLGQALSVCPGSVKPVLAEIHYFAGRAYEELGDDAGRLRHLRAAADQDPIGNYGRLALTAIVK
jgi:tetratricopeptide (TPR) repeat protein